MGPYDWGWLAVLLAAPLMIFALTRATRGWPLPEVRRLLGWLLGLGLVVPAPIPGHPGHYAPAFLVLLFEWLFQRPGKPATAGLILAAAAALALALALVTGILARRLRARRGHADEAP